MAKDSKDLSIEEFSVACMNGDLKKVKAMIASGIDVNKENAMGITPLCEAVRDNRSEVVDALLEAKADVNQAASSLNNRTALHEATQRNTYSILKKIN